MYDLSICLHSVALFIWYISSICGVYRNISLGFVLAQIHEVTFQDDPPRSALKSSGELERGTYRAGHTSELLFPTLRQPTEDDIYVK